MSAFDDAAAAAAPRRASFCYAMPLFATLPVAPLILPLAIMFRC